MTQQIRRQADKSNGRKKGVREVKISSCRWATAVIVGMILSLGATTATAEQTLEQQRELFLRAERALQKKQPSLYEALLPKLRDYPLYPYLLYRDLRQRLTTAKSDEFSLFFYNYGNTPLAPMLRTALLKHLAKKGRWKDYLAHYVPARDITLRCHYRTALLETGQSRKAFKGIEELWLSGTSRPAACDPLFKAARKAGKINHQLIRRRAYLALENGEISLASYLAKELSGIEQGRIARLAELQRHPERALKIRSLGNDQEATRRLLIKAIERLARKDFERAESAWNTLRGRFEFTPAEKAGVIRSLGLRLAWRHDPEALKWLARVGSLYDTAEVREWRVRLALRQGDWKETLKWLDRLKKKEQEKEEWRYWRARALENLGEKERATQIYETLARNRSYHGFLAADRLGRPYRFEQRPLVFSDRELESMLRIPAIQRAAELYRLGRIVPARREWNLALSHLQGDDLLKAAKLADSWGWHDRVIITLGRSDHLDDLDLRFPLLYRKQIFSEALKRGIDPAWVYGLIRQESAFMADVRSPAGALGLMQLMPATARQVARELRSRIYVPYDVLKPETNLRLGITYLSGRYQQFGRNAVLATAAYNAGPHRVNRWLPGEKPLAADQWIESIPFNETRKYVKRVLTYTAIYEKRLGQTPLRLQERMPLVSNTLDGGEMALTKNGNAPLAGS